MRPPPNPQNIHVVLNPKAGGDVRETLGLGLDVFLDMPFTEIRHLSFSPSRLLHYFCFIILGLKGTLHDNNDKVVALEGEEGGAISTKIEAGRTYLYHVEGDESSFTSSLVDPEAMRELGSNISSTSEGHDMDFRTRLIERDGSGIFSGTFPDYCHGQHIIAHSKIDNPRNGFLDLPNIHLSISKRNVFIFKTPNCYLHCEDIPLAMPNHDVYPGSMAPLDCRFTMMLVVDSPGLKSLHIESPSDAMFAEPSANDLPSGLLLDYFNAAVLLKNYLKGNETLNSYPFPRPPAVPVVCQQTFIPRSDNRKSLNHTLPPPGTKHQLEQNPDEYIDAMVLGFWKMSGNAQKRHEKEQQEHTEWINNWISASETAV
ncbi:hypothetical protein CPB84DRAFT_1790988 [Gymnopilus junonius]|uniref:Uncharacterized protein n=1 Tax=Gymnopilus junonius TaxID=109634 RepID=A0A9P5NE61_GYMJU|nr:hypothetical protein CPB84DRAFT_1790988 [Gymnopilus junonius]